jgi:hypothetical protein
MTCTFHKHRPVWINVIKLFDVTVTVRRKHSSVSAKQLILLTDVTFLLLSRMSRQYPEINYNQLLTESYLPVFDEQLTTSFGITYPRRLGKRC